MTKISERACLLYCRTGGDFFPQVWSVAYNPTGDKLVSGCDDGVLQVFEST